MTFRRFRRGDIHIFHRGRSRRGGHDHDDVNEMKNLFSEEDNEICDNDEEQNEENENARRRR